MRRALLADIHSNLEALEAVLADASEQQVGEIYCLGDVVGYGPDPVACIDLAMKFDLTILGNHDQAVIFEPDGFGPVALNAVHWTRQQLEQCPDPHAQQRLDWLLQLPKLHHELDRLYVYGSPREPTNEYVFPEDVFNQRKMNALFSRVEKYCFQGHTHIPGVYTDDFQFLAPEECDNVFPLPTGKMMCNVGSVGQSRDGDPRACYAILTDDSVIIRRIEYPFHITAAKIRDISPLDGFLGDRLGDGR